KDANPPVKQTYVDFLVRPSLVVGNQDTPSIEDNGARLAEEFLNLPLQLFNGATPLEAAQEERYRGDLLGLLCHLEGEQGLILPLGTITGIYQRLGLERPQAKLSLTA